MSSSAFLPSITAFVTSLRSMVASRPLLDDARTIGCNLVRLESLKSLAPAHALYRSAGFVEVPPHDDNRMRPYQDDAALGAYRDSAVFMAPRLRQDPV